MAKVSNPKRLLVLDDNDVFLSVLSQSLKSVGYHVIPCLELQSAKHLLGIDTVDAVITDVRLPNASGVDFMKYVKSLGNIPVILMTGFADLIEMKEALEQGADGFLAKPFRKEELIELLSKLLQSDKKDTSADAVDLDPEFCKLKIDEFVSGKRIRYDIFIRISKENYVKIAHEGEDIPADRIQAFKNKGITHLFLRKEDFSKYVGFQVDLVSRVSQSDKIDRGKKLAFMKVTGELLMGKLHLEDVDVEMYYSANAIVESTISVIAEHKDIFNLLTLLNDHSNALYAHCLGVSLYSVMIAKKLSWDSPQVLFKLGTGVLLHDIGKKEISAEILNKPRSAMTPEEIKIVESHTARGLNLLGSIPSMPGDVIHIVGQHHENCMGMGYPQGLSRMKIHPMAKIVGLVNDFCNLVIKNPNCDGVPAKDALNQLQKIPDKYEFTYLEALCALFQVQFRVEKRTLGR